MTPHDTHLASLGRLVRYRRQRDCHGTPLLTIVTLDSATSSRRRHRAEWRIPARPKPSGDLDATVPAIYFINTIFRADRKSPARIWYR